MHEVEIYVRADSGPILQWLQSLCAQPPTLRVRTQGTMVTRVGRCVLLPDGCAADVLVVESVAGGFTSVSFTAAALPWQDDLACARLAVSAIGCEVRCNAGAWRPDARGDEAQDDESRNKIARDENAAPHDDDGWYAVTPTGEGPIRWSTG